MHFFLDSIVSSVLEDPKRLRRGQLSSCISIYTAVLGFGLLRRSTSCIHAVVHVTRFYSYVQDVLYAGFAGAKNRPQKHHYF